MVMAIFAHMNISHVSFLHDFKVFISFLCSCFWTFGAFYILLGLDQIIKLEGNICLLNYNYLLLFTFHYYPTLYIPNVLGPFTLEPVVNLNQHTFKMHTFLCLFLLRLNVDFFFALLFCQTFFLPEPHWNYKYCHCTINEVLSNNHKCCFWQSSCIYTT